MPMMIPLVMAAVEVGAGVAAVTAAEVSLTAMILGGLEIAGGALSIIGTVTGNKTLSMIGAVAGMAGGVGSMINGAGAASSASGEMETMNDAYTAPSSVASADAAAPVDATTAADTGGPGDATDLSPGDVTSSPVSSPSAPNATNLDGSPIKTGPQTSLAQTPADNSVIDSNVPSPADVAKTPINKLADVNPTVDQAGNAINNQAASVGTQTGAVGSQTAAVGSPGIASPTGMSSQDLATMYGNEGYTGNAAGTPPAGSTWQSIKGGLSTAQDFAKTNPTLMNAAGGIITGAMKSASDQSVMKERYQQQLAYEQQNRDRINASVRGLAVPTYAAPKG